MRAVALGVILLSLLAMAPAAHACSCAGGEDPRDTLEGADGAFIGRYDPDPIPEPPPSDSGQKVDYHFVVDEVIKGDIGEEVDVRSPYSGASCGLEVREGEQVGLFLYRHKGEWTSGLCSQTTPETLRKAAKPAPAPNGEGPARFLLGGSMGPVRTFSLDARGRTLRYATGAGSTGSISVCPGADVFAELVYGVVENKWWTRAIAVRSVETLALRSEHRLTSFETKNGVDSMAVHGIACLDGDGGSVAVLGTHDNGVARIVLAENDAERETFEGKIGAVDLGATPWFVVQGTALREIDLRSGRVRHVGTVPPGTQLIDVSPDARHVLLSSTGDGDPSKRGHWLLDVAGRRLRRLDTKLFGYTWADDTTFAVFGLQDRVRIFDVSLRKVSQWTGWGYGGVVQNGVLYAAWYGTVVSAPVRTGPKRTLRTFEFSQNFSFVVVPPRPFQSSPPRPTKRTDPTPEPTASPSRPPLATPSATSSAPPQALPNDPTSSGSRSIPLAASALALAVIAAGLLVLRRRSPAR